MGKWGDVGLGCRRLNYLSLLPWFLVPYRVSVFNYLR